MDRITRDVRHAIRGLARRPLFTVVAVLSLALGVGASTAVFSVVNTLLLRPPAGVRDADRLVEVGRGYRGSGFDSFSFPDFQALAEQATPFDRLAAYTTDMASFRAGGTGVPILAADVSASYFPTLGATPWRGRLFAEEEDGPWDAHPVAVVDHRFWREHLGADPDIVGSTIMVNRTRLTVIGVLEPEFRGHVVAVRPQVYLPLSMIRVLKPHLERIEHPRSHWMTPIGRLADGASVDKARASARTVFAQLRAEQPDLYEDKTVEVRAYGPVPAAARSAVRMFMAVLLTLVGLVLLVTCANVAGMLLVRATERERELAVRAAMGAGRGALARPLIVEALLLFVIGGALGSALAWALTGLLPGIELPIPVPLDLGARPDATVLAFALAATLVTGLVFGSIPALPASRPRLVPSLKEGGRAPAPRTSRLRRGLVVAQVALSLVLLVAAGLFLRSLQRAGEMPAGFDPEGVYLVSMDLALEGYDEEGGRRLVDDLVQRVRAIPGVAAAGGARDLPMDLSSWGTPYWEANASDGEGEPPRIGSDINVVSPGYFVALHIPVLRGRAFTAADGPGAPPVAVVSRTLAETAWPDGEALGRRLQFDDDAGTVYTVVGVVEDVKNQFLTESAEPMAYRAYAQAYAPQVTVVAATIPGVRGVPEALRAAVLEVDPALALTSVTRLDRYTAIGLLPQRIAAGLASALGLLALFLSGLGLYGAVAYAFARRTREVGIRIAVGAGRAEIRRLVLRSAAGLVLPGVLLGGLAGVGIGHLVRGLLIGVAPLDVPTFAAVALALAVTVFAATLVPARRAVAVEPMEALRSE